MVFNALIVVFSTEGQTFHQKGGFIKCNILSLIQFHFTCGHHGFIKTNKQETGLILEKNLNSKNKEIMYMIAERRGGGGGFPVT